MGALDMIHILELGAGQGGWANLQITFGWKKDMDRTSIPRELVLCWEHFWSGKGLLWGSQEMVPFQSAFLSLGIQTRKKWWINRVTTQKKILKSFWFHSPTLYLFAFEHLEQKVSITSHPFSFFAPITPPTQIWPITQNHLNYTVCFCHLWFLSFSPGHTQNAQISIICISTSLLLPSTVLFHSFLLQPNF